MRGMWVALAAVLLAGCFSEILPAPPETTLGFICAVLDPDVAETLVVKSWIGNGVDVEPGLAVSSLQAELAAITGRDAEHVRSIERGGLPTPADGWNEGAVRTWAESQTYLGRGLVNLHILWVSMWEDGSLSGSVPVPGVVVLSQAAIRQGAADLETSEAILARILLLHFAGHALGVVNRGVAVQDPDIQEREGPPGHDPDPASVLHVGWDDVRTMAWAANATYDRYSDDLRRDWAAATRPGGACL